MQTSWWAEFRARSGWRHFGVVLRDGAGIAGGAVVMKFCYSERRCYYYIPEGPVLPDDEALADQAARRILEEIEARRTSEEQLVSHLRIEPRWRRVPRALSAFRAVDVCMEPRDTLCVDLQPSEEAILLQMKPKGRYNVGVAKRHGVTVVEDASPAGIEGFLRLYDDTVGRKQFDRKPPGYFQAMMETLSKAGRGSLLFAEYSGTRLATAIVIFFGPRATYFYGGSAPIHREVMAPYLLHFEAMRRAKARGNHWYDLWGIAPAGRSNHPWSGISDFKRRFGGQETNLVPTLDYVFHDAAYRAWSQGTCE